MQKWEYLIVTDWGKAAADALAELRLTQAAEGLEGKTYRSPLGSRSSLFLLDWLQYMGEQGWELVSTNKQGWYFKRVRD